MAGPLDKPKSTYGLLRRLRSFALAWCFAIIDLAMQSPLQRLYKTKFALVVVVATVGGYALMRTGSWVATQPGLQLVKDTDLFDIGVALMTAGLVGVAFQFVGAADAGQEAKRQFREAIREEAPDIQRSVVNAIALAPRSILDVTAPDVLDRVVENSLAKQLGDEAFAADIYRDLKAQVLRSPERWHDLRVSITLTPWESKTTATAAPMFVATFRYDYRASNMATVMRFASVSDLDEYRELQADPDMTEVWYFEPKAGLDGASPEVFQLVEVAVDGTKRTIRPTTRAGMQLYSVRVGSRQVEETNERTTSFTYRGLVQQHGHLLRLDLTKPTRGLSVNLSYGGAGIRYVNVADYIAAAKQPAISRVSAADPSPSVSLAFDGWVLPKAGVAFSWVLEREIAADHRSTTSLSDGDRLDADRTASNRA